MARRRDCLPRLASAFRSVTISIRVANYRASDMVSEALLIWPNDCQQHCSMYSEADIAWAVDCLSIFCAIIGVVRMTKEHTFPLRSFNEGKVFGCAPMAVLIACAMSCTLVVLRISANSSRVIEKQISIFRRSPLANCCAIE